MRVAIFTGSFSPPCSHHQQIVRELARQFERVIVVPSATRPEKPSSGVVSRIYRATMADLAFSGIANVSVDLFDLEQGGSSPLEHLQQRYQDDEVWHVVGANLIEGGEAGISPLQRLWQLSTELWQQSNFVIVSRHGVACRAADMPPKHSLLDLQLAGSSNEIRSKLFRGEPVEDLLAPDVRDYIDRHQLYRGGVPQQVTAADIGKPRLKIVADRHNPRAEAWLSRLQPYAATDRPNLIAVVGGDGTMLHAIQEHWRLRLPFFGINTGHLGFLMNDQASVDECMFPPSPVVLRQLPMIRVEFLLEGGETHEALSFNDVWIERVTGQTAWFRLSVNGEKRFSKMVSDGVLLSTAAGSTAYAYSMGATPLLADTPAWLVVGNNVMQPRGWKSAMLSPEDTVEISVLDPQKRPVQGYVYGVPVGEVLGLRASISRVASVELAFCQNHDMARKITRLQFPPDGSSEDA